MNDNNIFDTTNLIQCPACKSWVSPNAQQCIKCGQPIVYNKSIGMTEQQAVNNHFVREEQMIKAGGNIIKGVLKLFGTLILIFVIWMLISLW